jgi:hypothetical protein
VRVKKQSLHLHHYVDRLQESGRYTFARDEALKALKMSPVALKLAARRLSRQGRVISPRRGFFAIVPLEYKSAGSPPPSWFIDQLMEFQNEAVLGDYGGQFSSFDWVFSPRGLDGAPEPLFDRMTGAVHPDVAQYWKDHYDLTHLVSERWSTQHDLLKGRIHLIVGTADTFYLDGAVHLLDRRLQELGAQAHVVYMPGRTHFDLFTLGTDELGLFDAFTHVTV